MGAAKSSHCGTVSIGGSQKFNMTEYGFRSSATMLYNRSDCFIYPQFGATTDHMAQIDVTTLDLLNAAQVSGTQLIGSDAGQVQLVAHGGAGQVDVAMTISKCAVRMAEANGRFGDLWQARLGFDAAGTGGNEPTVSLGAA